MGFFLVKNYHGLSAIPSFLHRLHSQLSSRAWTSVTNIRDCHSLSTAVSPIFSAHTKIFKIPVKQGQARGTRTRISHTRSKIKWKYEKIEDQWYLRKGIQFVLTVTQPDGVSVKTRSVVRYTCSVREWDFTINRPEMGQWTVKITIFGPWNQQNVVRRPSTHELSKLHTLCA